MTMARAVASSEPIQPTSCPSTFLRILTLVIAGLPCVNAALPSDDNGDQFSNNLFSDLAPLIALFGEQVSKQFISNSTSFVDNIIFAMAPLGIITAVVSAIRVGGPRWLRGVIGRARESRGDVETELMSSTSGEVCELWRDEGLVRVKGSPDIAQLLFEKNGQSWKVKSLEEYSPRDHDEAGRELSVAPNLALNLIPQPTALERWLIAIFGIALQCGVLVFDALVTYRLRWFKDGIYFTKYSFPFTAVGTLAICTGLIMCTYVIEASTSETKVPVPQLRTRVVWLQRSQRVDDQVFSARAFVRNDDKNRKRKRVSDIFTSRRNKRSFYITTVVGTLVSIVGFIIQFVGLRGMHWSATIAQLGATFLMTILRSYLRRGLFDNTLGEEVMNAHELDWLSMDICECAKWRPVGIRYETRRQY